MVKALKAGLLALTILATSAPALAQHGGWGGHGGGGNGGGGGEQHQGNPGGNGYRGGGEAGGASRWNGGGNRGGQPGGAVQAPQPSAPAPAPARNWGNEGGGNRPSQWQGQRPQGQSPQFMAPPRPAQNFQGENRGNGQWNNSQWNNRGGGAPGFARPEAARPVPGRPGFGQPNYARPGNGWQAGPRLSNSDRWRDQRRWTNDWRRDSRYDWTRYRQSYRDYYHMPAYRAPVGWGYGYSRYSIGVYLGSPLFASSYWIDDPYSYRLPPAYGTLRWVRYYDDALLVDIRDGYVVDVIHDFFW